jgi:hypothetical protein
MRFSASRLLSSERGFIRRFLTSHSYVLTSLLCLLLIAPTFVRADAFDNYFNDILAQVPASKNAQKVKELTPTLMVQNSRALPKITATFLVVKTNGGRFSKLLVQPGRQKISADESVPIFLIDRYVTYKEGDERTVHAKGQNVRLFSGFRFNLDIGQVVPAGLAADLRFVVDGDNVHVEPVGKAEIYLVTKHFPEADPAKGQKLVVGDKFEARYFNGTFKLHDDGRRSGTLKLNVTDQGDVTGDYYSDKDGQKYEVSGKVGMPNNSIQFRITLPRTIQFFTGFMFTGDGRVIAGSSRLQERELGFYAVRVE